MTDSSAVSPQDAIGHSALRKATWRLIPLIALGYGCSYMDRVNISFAALQMNRDLHFSTSIYTFGAGLFFLSYAACEVPSNLALYRFGARRWLSRIMLTWGVIAACMLFVRTPTEFYIGRFLLGMAEAGFFPGVVFYLMQWFPPEQRARAVGRFYISLPLSAVLMGSIAGILLDLNGRGHLAGWQWLFLIEGLPAVALSVVFLVLLPDGPADAPWLTADERNWFARAVDRTGDHIHTPSEPILSVLIDPRVWQIGIFGFLMLTAVYGIHLLLPQLVQGSTGLDATRVGFITAGINLLGVPAMLLGAKLSDRAPSSRCLQAMPGCLGMALGLAAAGFSNRPAVLVPGLAFALFSFYEAQGPWLAIIPSVFRGRSSAAAIAAVNTFCILGGFVGPNIMGVLSHLTGNYQRGLLILSTIMLIDAAIMLYLRSRIDRPVVPAVASATIADALESPNL